MVCQTNVIQVKNILSLREKNYLEELWLANKAPWRIWSE